MKSLMETYTPLTNSLQDLNQEIRQKLSSMHFYTEQEMRNLAVWQEEVDALVKDLDNLSSIISHHSQILKIKLQESL